MSDYSFVPELTVAENVRKIGIQQIDLAHDSLMKTKNLEKGIYSARKCTKRLRALLRLVRRALPQGAFERENGAFREIAEVLGGLRDAWVRIETLDQLPPDALATDAFQQLRAHFVSRYDSLSAEFLTPGRYEAVKEQIEQARVRMEALQLQDRGWSTLAENLVRTIRSGRRAYKAARHDRNEITLHEWRKRIKHLWYHLTLLRDASPLRLYPLIMELDELGEMLGKAHDWAVLREDSHRVFRDLPGFLPLYDAMTQAEKMLEEEALQRGQNLYDELRTRRFVALLGVDYHQWRHNSAQAEVLTNDPAL